MNKEEAFNRELNYIKNKNYQESARILVREIPDYFFEVAASSTGKYHPSFSLGEGGLLRHTKVVCKIAKSLLEDQVIGDKYTSDEKDLMIIAMIFHDSIKHGFENDPYTKADHPLAASKFIKDNQEKTKFNEKEVTFICNCINSHMGPWNKDYKTDEEILPLPKTKYENFVHMCDYLASRKFLDVKFLNNEVEE